MALLGGACFADRRAAFAVPLAAMLLSDVALGLLHRGLSSVFRPMTVVIYGCFATTVCLGFLLRARRRALPIAGAALGTSVVFFAVTNFGVWALQSLYPRTWGGLLSCYGAALPFLRNTILGDATYALVLFGGLALTEREFQALRDPVRADDPACPGVVRRDCAGAHPALPPSGRCVGPTDVSVRCEPDALLG